MSQSIAISCCAAIAAGCLLLTGCGGGEGSAHGSGHPPAKSDHGGGHGGGGHGAEKKPAKSSHGGGHGAAKSAHGGSSSHGGGQGSHDKPDAIDLLDGLRRTPEESVEVDLGSFIVSRHLNANSTLRVKFQLIGLVDERQHAEFAEALAARQQAMRDRVLEISLKLDLEHFDDPTLRALKSDLLVEIQRAVRSLAIHEVLVSDYLMERR